MSHTFYKLYYHLIWTTKNRLPIIEPWMEKELKIFIPRKINQLNGMCLALTNIEDHIHVLASIPPKISIAEFVHTIKGFNGQK